MFESYYNNILIPRWNFERPFLLAMIFLVILESMIVGWKKSSLGLILTGKRTFLWEIFSFFIQITGLRKMMTLVFLLGATKIIAKNLEPYYLHIWTDWNSIVKYIVAFVAFDFLHYWFHRFRHTNNWIWTVHEFHHSATKVNLFTSYRVHPIDYLFYVLLLSVPFEFIFGSEGLDSTVFSILSTLPGYYSHSRWDVRLGWIGRYVLVTPRFHQLHHSKGEEKYHNFGHGLVIWDRLFGTYLEDARSMESFEQGLPVNYFETQNPILAFLQPVKKFYLIPLRALKKSFTY